MSLQRHLFTSESVTEGHPDIAQGVNAALEIRRGNANNGYQDLPWERTDSVARLLEDAGLKRSISVSNNYRRANNCALLSSG